MKIVKIVHDLKTDKEDYTEITFKERCGFFLRKWGPEFTERCITPKGDTELTYYAGTGEWIPVCCWGTVKAFIRTGDAEHIY